MKITNRLITLIVALLATAQLSAQGSITGSVMFEGKGPRLRPIKMDADPVCSAAHSKPVIPESVVVNGNGTLKNVLISITAGLDGMKFETPTEPVILDQNGCMYSPHVWGVMAGQPVEIRNSDATLHNIHSMSKINRSFNIAMPKVVKKKMHTFDKTEDPFTIKCDVHPWMRTWAGVFAHPYFTVTDDSGSFTLENVPDGTYTVKAWHESSKRLPAQSMEITVSDGKAATLDFTFKVAAR